MTQRSKSTLFLIEQLIVIAVFAICAAACISILVAAYFYTTDSKTLSQATIKAESGAEAFKVTGSDFASAADILGGSTTTVGLGTSGVSVIAVYYDNNWQVSNNNFNASYVMNLIIESAEGDADISLISGRVVVSSTAGDEIISLNVAMRERIDGE